MIIEKPSFHKTIPLSAAEVLEKEENAKSQEEKIMYLFRAYNQKMTPSDVYKRYQLVWPAIPITSCRRALSNLTRDNKLNMLDEMKMGMYGVREHFWALQQ
jgi:hypothetical protein